MARDVTSTFNSWVFSLDNETQNVFINTGNIIPENGLEITLPKIIIAGYKKLNINKKGFYSSIEFDIDVTTDGRRNSIIKSGIFSLDPHLGIQIGFKNYVSLRSGISNLQYVTDFENKKRLNIQPNIGLGFNFKNFYLDYAFTDIGNASVSIYSHIISMRLKFKQPKKIRKNDN